MFTSVTWQQYIIFILIVSFIYYVFILISFYKTELSDFFKGIRSIHRRSEIIAGDKISFNDLLDELKSVFQLAFKRKYPKEELMLALQSRLKEFDHFKNTDFEQAVKNFIAEESENICSIHLEEKEIDGLWKE